MADEVIVVGPASGAFALTELEGLPAAVRITVVVDPVTGGGPLIGLRTGLAAVTSDRVIVVGGDMPRLAPAVLRVMLERLGDTQRPTRSPDATAAAEFAARRSRHAPAAPVSSAGGLPDAVLLGQAGGGRPLPVALRSAEARHAVEAAISGREASLQAALARLTMVELPEDQWRRLDPTGRSLLDVDTPADLDNVGRL